VLAVKKYVGYVEKYNKNQKVVKEGYAKKGGKFWDMGGYLFWLDDTIC
jgi:hypothetical protein